MPFFSVIIPNYNHAPFLRERIDSVLAQTFTDFEVIILDDFSTDGSRDIIESYRSQEKITHIVYNDQNSGSPFAQWKKGIEMATGDWIWIAESDDIAEPDFLNECKKLITSYPQAGVCYCDSQIETDGIPYPFPNFSIRKKAIFKTSKWEKEYYREGIDEINENLKYDSTINNTSAMVFKRELFVSHLSQLNNFRYYGDWYLSIRLCLSGGIAYTPAKFNTYRKHEASFLHATTSLLQSKKEYFLLLQFLYQLPGVKDKPSLLDHFVYNYLSFGLRKDGIAASLAILRNYFAQNSSLACKVTWRLFLTRLQKKKYQKRFDINRRLIAGE